MTLFLIALAILAAVILVKAFGWEYKARVYGTETDACVNRIERDVRTADGADYVRHFYYMLYRNAEGLETEARLVNPKKKLVVGSKVRIRYLPEKDNTAVLTEITEA